MSQDRRASPYCASSRTSGAEEADPVNQTHAPRQVGAAPVRSPVGGGVSNARPAPFKQGV